MARGWSPAGWKGSWRSKTLTAVKATVDSLYWQIAGIEWAPASQELEVQVGAGGIPAHAHQADRVAGEHRVPWSHPRFEQVGVEGAEPAPMIHDHARSEAARWS